MMSAGSLYGWDVRLPYWEGSVMTGKYWLFVVSPLLGMVTVIEPWLLTVDEALMGPPDWFPLLSR